MYFILWQYCTAKWNLSSRAEIWPVLALRSHFSRSKWLLVLWCVGRTGVDKCVRNHQWTHTHTHTHTHLHTYIYRIISSGRMCLVYLVLYMLVLLIVFYFSAYFWMLNGSSCNTSNCPSVINKVFPILKYVYDLWLIQVFLMLTEKSQEDFFFFYKTLAVSLPMVAAVGCSHFLVAFVLKHDIFIHSMKTADCKVSWYDEKGY